jgi:proteasome component ECM29
VIGSLKSPSEPIKKKVLEILSHVNKRVKGQLNIKLPITELLTLCSMEPIESVPSEMAALIRSFALVYIEMAFDRATPQQKLDAVPSLAHQLHLRPSQHRSICLRLVVSGLEAAGSMNANSLVVSTSSSSISPTKHQAISAKEEAKLTPSEQAVQSVLTKWPFLSSHDDSTILLDYFLKYLLYQTAPIDPKQRANTPLATANLAQQQAQAPSAFLTPGLSPSDVKELEEKDGVAPKHLYLRKMGILGFLAASSPALILMKNKPVPSDQDGNESVAPLKSSSERLLLPLLAGAADPSSDVQSKAEELLKRLCSIDGPRPSIDLEHPVLISKMMRLFHGTSEDETVTASERKQPASLPIKIRLMHLFNRSIAAANTFPFTVQTIAVCIYGTSTNARLKSLGMEFAVWVFKHAAEHQLKAMGPKMLQGLLETFGGGEASEALPQDQASCSLRGFAYQAVGCLAQRVPSLLVSRIDIARLFFKALADEPAGLRSTVSESVSSLAKAFMQSSSQSSDQDAMKASDPAADEHRVSLEQLLIESIQSPKDAVRSCAVQWANRVFPKSHALSRYICILAAGDLKIEVKEEGLKGLGLHPTSPNAQDEGSLKLADLIACLREQRPLIFAGSISDSYRSLPLTPKSFLSLLSFVKRCWAKEPHNEPESIASYLSLMEGALCRDSTGDLIAESLRGILDVALIDIKSFSMRYAPKLPVLKRYLGHTDAGARLAASKVFGAVCDSLDQSVITSLLTELCGSIKPGSASVRYEDKEGAIMAIGFVLAECSRQSSSSPLLDAVNNAVMALLWTISPSISTQSAQPSGGSTVDDGLTTAAAIALGFASLRGTLDLSFKVKSDMEQSSESMDIDKTATDENPILSRLLAKLSDLMLDHRDPKSAVRAITASGYLLSGARSSSSHHSEGQIITSKLLEAIFKLASNKAEEIQFAAGEAIAFAFGCIPLTADQILLSNFDGLANEFRLLSPSAPEAVKDAGGDVSMTDSSKGEEGDAFVSRPMILAKLLNELIVNTKQEVNAFSIESTTETVLIFFLCHVRSDVQQRCGWSHCSLSAQQHLSSSQSYQESRRLWVACLEILTS